MNILQVLPELNVGGVETGTLDLSRHLVRLGHKAVVISAGGQLVAELEQSGAKHYKLPVQSKSVFNILKMSRLIAEIIKKENIDIVHARSRAPAWSAYLAARKTGATFISTCHGYYSRHPFSFVMGWGRRVIVLSNVIARHMIDDFGVPRERICLVPRSVDLEKFKFSLPSQRRGKNFNVGIIARITPLKGHMYFIKAMARLLRLVPNLKIWVVGDAPASKEAYKEQLELLTKRLGLSECTEFLGLQRNIPEIMSQLDLLVMATTTHEAFGRTIIEAQASGVPVVSTRVGGAVDIIEDGFNGLLVAPADPSGISDACFKVYSDAGLADCMADNALKKVVKSYGVELMVKNTLNTYEDALKDKKILVLKMTSIGDVILATASLEALRKKFPLHKISVLVGEESKDVLLRSPFIDELLVCDFKGKDAGFLGLWRLGTMLRKKDFQMVIDLQNSRSSHILSALSLSPERYGYDNKKLSFLLNHRLKDTLPAVNPVKHQFRLLNMLGVQLNDERLNMWPSEEDEKYIDELLASHWLSPNQKLVGLNLSASPRWQTKGLAFECLVKICSGLNLGDTRVVITGTAADEGTASRLLADLKESGVINACGKTSINQLACLIRRCSVYVSADSSPLHVAAAMNVPIVALFGPTDPLRHLPPAEAFRLLQKELRCSPCYKTKCKSKRCMDSITPDEVIAAVRSLKP